MLIDDTKYNWTRSAPIDIELTETVQAVSFDPVLRVYLFEGTGRISIYADEEQTELIYSGELPYEPDQPIACDGLTFSSESAPTTVRLITESGEVIDILAPYLNTTEGMAAVSGAYNDDSTYSTEGLTGFKFNGIESATMYVSSNHWLGFSTSSEQLRIMRRDGCSTAIYRQEGICENGLDFLKIRFEGYTVYNNRVEANRLIFELFLLSNNDMFLNAIQTPTSGNTGTSELICNNTTTALSLIDTSGEGKGTQVSFYHLDDEGRTWQIEYAAYEAPSSYSVLYLIRTGGIFYTVEDDALVAVDITELTAAAFLKYGMDVPPPSAVLTPVANPEIFCWKSGGEAQKIKDKIVAYPYPQTITAYIDMSHISILGISMMTAEYSGTVMVKYSVDSGGSFTEEMALSDFLNLDPDVLYESLGEDKILILHFVLHDNAAISRFKITYEN